MRNSAHARGRGPSLLVGTVLLLTGALVRAPIVEAQEGVDEAHQEDLSWVPLELSLFSPVEPFFFVEPKLVAPLHVTVIYGSTAAFVGFQIGAIFNEVERWGAGVQASAILNRTDGPVYGLQVAGVANFGDGSCRGICVASFYNGLSGDSWGIMAAPFGYSETTNFSGIQASLGNADNGDFSGVQLGVIANWVKQDVYGLQIGGGNIAHHVPGEYVHTIYLEEFVYGGQIGFINAASNVHGFQISLLVNWVEVSARGLQFGAFNGAGGGDDRYPRSGGIQIGAVNFASKFTGLQIAAFNWTTDMRGVQIGAINVAESIEGFQLGFINVVVDGSIPVLPVINAGW